jgi:hypothetical protein
VIPVIPSFREVVVITRGTATVSVKARRAVVGVGAEESVNDTVKLKDPDAVGVPKIIPVVGSNASPGGRLPLKRAHTAGALPPKELSVAE